MKFKPKFPIGTTYRKRGKRKDVCTVVDVIRHINMKDEVTKITYVTEHDFLGQTITEHGVVETTIAMGLIEIGRGVI